MESIWGSGTYYSTRPSLAMKYQHRLHSGVSAFSSYLAGVKGVKGWSGFKQVMAVDVLTGDANEMEPDQSMCNPPKIEDDSIGKRLGISELRYDSIKAVHPHGDTHIYITYNRGHGYPSFSSRT
ncbi:hypothetical protein ABBQ32_004552 [Trebouxia sp. C0010 RCD-2024]